VTTPNGLLLVDKDAGPTSHDVVARVRRLVGEKRVGHAGTLDPMATGLLVLALGPSTRLLRFAQAGEKQYEGRALLGVATDSLDADGAVVARVDVPAFSDEDLESAALSLTGEQLQVPPMVSAIKVAGTRLHELARRGEEVERAPRAITVSAFSVTRSGEDEISFAVTCTTGTYVRVLLSDLAERLGTVGHLVALRRTRSGSHRVTDALTLGDLTERVGRGETPWRPPASFVEHLAHVTLGDDDVVRVRRGQRVALDAPADEVAALDGSGALVAVLARRGDLFQPELVLPDEHDDGQR